MWTTCSRARPACSTADSAKNASGMRRGWIIWSHSRSPRGSSRSRLDGAILSRGEDYFEGQGHGLYLIDGKVRLHMTLRCTDIGLRDGDREPGAARRMAARVGDLRRQAPGQGCTHLCGWRLQQIKMLFDELEAAAIDRQDDSVSHRRRRRQDDSRARSRMCAFIQLR